MGALECVDYVTIFDAATVDGILCNSGRTFTPRERTTPARPCRNETRSARTAGNSHRGDPKNHSTRELIEQDPGKTKPMSAPEKILIVRLSSLGDILHAIPAFQSLRAAFPHAEIDWLVEERMKFLLVGLPGLHQLMVLDTRPLRSRPWNMAAWRDCSRLIRKLRARHYDVALDFQGLLKTALLTFLAGARVRMGFSRSLVRERPAHWFYHREVTPPSTQAHVARLNQELARAAGGIQARAFPAQRQQ